MIADQPQARKQSSRWLLAVAIFALLALGVFSILQPFLEALAWAVVLVLSTWPIYRRLRIALRNRPTLSALLMTLFLAAAVVALVGPVLFTLGREVSDTATTLEARLRGEPPVLPDMIRRVPLLGPALTSQIGTIWANKMAFVTSLGQYRETLVPFLTRFAQGIVSSLLTLLMCLFTCFFLYRDGRTLAHQFRSAAVRLGGPQFERLIEEARLTIRGAVYGVLLTAVVQGTLAGIGYAAAGASFPVLLGFITMVASLVPFGTPVVYVPTSLYLMHSGNTVAGVLLLVWGVCVVSLVDNLLRPLFISQSTKMPILLSFIAVIGGLMAFGILGIFVGPTLMAVSLVLWHEWVTSPHEE